MEDYDFIFKGKTYLSIIRENGEYYIYLKFLDASHNASLVPSLLSKELNK